MTNSLTAVVFQTQPKLHARVRCASKCPCFFPSSLVA